MKKIPTLFLRAQELGEPGWLVRPQVRPGCEWVLAHEGIPTEKIDGTACAIIDGRFYKRRTVAQDTALPPEAIDCGFDGTKRALWIPVGDAPDEKWHREAYYAAIPEGTYELVGPKVQSNPYGLRIHVLWRHGKPIDLTLRFDGPETPQTWFDALHRYLEQW